MRHEPMSSTLVSPAPECAYARLLLYGIRRMAAGGLNDAFAAQAMLTGFGQGFRRPLILLRALMAEAARISSIRIAVAPCCCPRMTPAEEALLRAVAESVESPERAHRRLGETLHVHSCLGLVTSAQALAAAFADHGMPLGQLCD